MKLQKWINHTSQHAPLKKKSLRISTGLHQAHLICVTMTLSTSSIMVSNERPAQKAVPALIHSSDCCLIHDWQGGNLGLNLGHASGLNSAEEITISPSNSYPGGLSPLSALCSLLLCFLESSQFAGFKQDVQTDLAWKCMLTVSHLKALHLCHFIMVVLSCTVNSCLFSLFSSGHGKQHTELSSVLRYYQY